ncbi:lipase family protein [Mycobacterium sp. 141]|uniref:lipase family protein n=1 Tax=Mycobacterium sp. 141 TaxID=1120797 RepID=UPI00055D1632|nr:lipase family protein [Mycobacterium sp. 141]
MPAIAPADWSGRGTLLQSFEHPKLDFSELPAGSGALTMTYRSISGITGQPTVVSGAVFTPPEPPPPGGWPVIGYAHGTVGVTSDCGPTADPRLFGDLTAVAIQLRQGYAVVFTDYAGLQGASPTDASDPHPYLEPKSAAFNLIDAVRAARTAVPDLSSRWVALGASQGGETAWAAAEYFAAYGEGTDLLGSAAIAPTLDMSPLVQSAQASTLTTDQRYLYPYIVTGLAGVDKSIKPDDYLHDALRDNRTTLIACRADSLNDKGELSSALANSDTRPSSPAAAERLASLLAAYALPQQPTQTPILAIYGGRDDTVPAAWTEVAMGRACALGDTIMRVRIEDAGHTLDPGAVLGQWLTDRFAGIPATGNC